jgi:hypothetical protein
MGIMQVLEKIDSRHIITITLIAIILPLALPQYLSVTGIAVTDMARGYVAYLDKIQPGDDILIQCSFSAMHFPEVQSACIESFQEIIDRGANLLVFSTGVEPLILDSLVIPHLKGAVYGQNYMYFLQNPGTFPACASFAVDPRIQSSVDNKGNKLSDMPMLKTIFANMNATKQAFMKQMKLILSVGMLIPTYISAWTIPYGVPTIADNTTMFASLVMPYFAAGVVKGMLAGPVGEAQYETLRGTVGAAFIYTSAMSLVVVVLLIFLVIANLIQLHQRKKGGK